MNAYKETRLFTGKAARHSSRVTFVDIRIAAPRLKLFGKVSFIITQLKLESCRYNQDPPLTCKGMDETCTDETCEKKIESLAVESSSHERTSDAKNLQDDEDDERVKRGGEIILSADFGAYRSTRSVSSSDAIACRDCKGTSPNLSNCNSGKSVFFFNFYRALS